MNKFDFKKSFGQNFLKDSNVINKIVESIDIDKDTLLIEIGPGSGALSKKIIPLSGFALLYEIDVRLKEILYDELSENDNYKIIFNDFLLQDIKFDLQNYNYKKVYVVANLPYYITTPIITKLIKEVLPDKILIMVQDEVASRLASKEGSKKYGMISVLIGSKYDVRKLFKVGRNCFLPVPNVDSAVISLIRNNEKKINDDYVFEKLIKDAFKYKRKNLKNNLKSYDLSKIDKILSNYSYSLNNRAEDIPVCVYIDIANNLF